jgi:hypothetical protein
MEIELKLNSVEVGVHLLSLAGLKKARDFF